MDAVLAPGSVAVIGASNEPWRIGGRPIAFMAKAGFQGKIFPVNPRYETVQGLKCYGSVDDLPEAPDAALIAVPAKFVIETLEALGKKGCRAVSVFSAGFAELGADGIDAQKRITEIAKTYGMRLLGPNTLGVCNAKLGYYGTFSALFDISFPILGNIGIASQSGAFGTHLAALARTRNLGTSVLVTTGNEADLTVTDAIDWMVADPSTDVICAYLEAINDGPGLIDALEAARAAGKPVIVLKAGSSALGAQAAASHTASLAGDSTVAEAILQNHGALLVDDPETMMDFAYLASKKVFPKTRSLGVVTVSGGAGIVISDEAERLGLALPPMPQQAQAALREVLPYCSPINPLDCTAQAVNEMDLLETFTRAALEEGGYGAVLCFLTYVAGSPVLADAVIEKLKPLREEFPDRILAICALGDPAILSRYEEAGICVFSDPVRAVRAIDAVSRAAHQFEAPEAKSLTVPAEHIALPATTPDEAEAKTLLIAAGIAAVPEAVASSPDQAAALANDIGYPVVLKVLSPDILHKSDIGGVRLGIGDETSLREAYASIEAAIANHAPTAKVNGILVAKQVSGGVECFMGIKQDPAFGPVAAFGLGGIFVEIMKDITLRQCPFDEAAARETILSIAAAPLLTGARGRPPCDVTALAQMLSTLSHFSVAAGHRLLSVDLNPVVALPEGQGAFALDAVIEVEPEGMA